MNSNWSYSPETRNLGQNWRYFEPCDLEIWQMTLKNNRAPLLSNIKLCASFHHHMWIQTGVTVRKQISWVLTSMTLTFDLWPFAWTSLLSLVITPENFMMIRWWEHSQKGVTDRRTDRQTYRPTDWTIHGAAWSQLKTIVNTFMSEIWAYFYGIFALIPHHTDSICVMLFLQLMTCFCWLPLMTSNCTVW